MKIKSKLIYFICGVAFFCIALLMGESILFCVVIGGVAGVLSFVTIRVTEQKKIKNRNRSYEMDLPDIMIHIAMFTEAGLGLQDAIERATRAGVQSKPLYVDLTSVFEKVRKGATKDFITGLEELAKVRKSPALSNFCTTIIQNMRKGSGEISNLFTAQAQLYRNERRRIAGKLADEAATLLLIPSTLVLLALIVMLLAPAIMELFNGF